MFVHEYFFVHSAVDKENLKIGTTRGTMVAIILKPTFGHFYYIGRHGLERRKVFYWQL